jgi:hypothetical protein
VHLLGDDHIENSLPYIVVTFLRRGVYWPSYRNDSSSTVACIRCRENVYGHMSQHVATLDILCEGGGYDYCFHLNML